MTTTQRERAQAAARAAVLTAPPILWAVDPATYETGLALFHDGRLVKAWTLRIPKKSRKRSGPEAMGMVLRATLAGQPYVTEHPQNYPGQTAKMKAVAMMREVLDHLHPAVARYHPGEWKGNIPKDVHHRRLKAMDLFPLSLVEDDNNAWDAVGLGLFHLGIVGRGGAT